MVLEWSFGIALLFLAEAAEVERIVLAGGVNVVGEQIVVRDQVPLVGVVPEPTGILDQLAVVVDERVVDGNRAVVAIARLRVVLQPLEAVGIDVVGLPWCLGQPAVEAGLVRAIGEFARDATDRLVLSNQQASKVLGEVPS